MSAAFSLDYSGDPVPCDFKGCILEAWHEGEHEFPAAQPKPKRMPTYHCVVCGAAFEVYGAEGRLVFATCGAQACLEHYARRWASAVPVLCSCPQRPYPHELSIHTLIRSEWWAHKGVWPWSLMQSVREEPSCERKAA